MYISKKPEDRRKEILEMAEKLFLTNGYKKTSMDKISKELGVAKGTCYHYFDTKESLYQEVLRKCGEEYMTSLNEVLSNYKLSAKERLKQVLYSASNRFLSSSNFILMTMNDNNKETFDQVRLHCFRDLMSGIKKCLEDGVKERAWFLESPLLCAHAVVYSIFGITSAQADSKDMIKEMYRCISCILGLKLEELIKGEENE